MGFYNITLTSLINSNNGVNMKIEMKKFGGFNDKSKLFRIPLTVISKVMLGTYFIVFIAVWFFYPNVLNV